jgi:hypothetical protein
LYNSRTRGVGCLRLVRRWTHGGARWMIISVADGKIRIKRMLHRGDVFGFVPEKSLSVSTHQRPQTPFLQTCFSLYQRTSVRSAGPISGEDNHGFVRQGGSSRGYREATERRYSARIQKVSTAGGFTLSLTQARPGFQIWRNDLDA